nr:MAG TPA: hypothetical protein [Caudoviricetes sp.]
MQNSTIQICLAHYVKSDFIVFQGMRNIFIIYMHTDTKSLFQF